MSHCALLRFAVAHYNARRGKENKYSLSAASTCVFSGCVRVRSFWLNP